MVVCCLERDADLHMVQLMPLPLTVSCFSEIQIGFTFLVLAHLGSPGKRAVKWVCVCVCVFVASREVYHTKRMQRVIAVQWSLDNKFILSGSEEMNLRVWKANSSAKLGVVCNIS